MGRAPCCDKANVKKGPWSPEEDAKLKSYIEEHGTGGNWIALPQKIGLKRCGKSCRLRWLNYLRPNIKHGGFSEEEDNIICSLYISIGSRWSIIAAQLPGRTDNDIKNYWNTRLKKKLLGKQRKEHKARRGSCLIKQGMRKLGSEQQSSSMVSSTNHINQAAPYWPDLPLSAAPIVVCSSNQEPPPPLFNDHASIRKLLIKLGGKFSDDNHDHNHHHHHLVQEGTNLDPTPLNLSQPQGVVPSIEMISSASTEALNACASQLSNSLYNIEGPNMALLAGETSFQADFEEMVYNNTQKLDGLEFLYGDHMVISNGTQTTGDSIEWGGEMSPLSNYYPSLMISNYEGGLQQGTLQEALYLH